MSDEFNWVEARNNCTAASAFSAMYAAVCADLKTRISQDERLRTGLEIGKGKPDSFHVRKFNSHDVVFERVGETIKVTKVHMSGTARPILTVTVGMNEQGECTLREGDRELLPWQVRRIALEDTLFAV